MPRRARSFVTLPRFILLVAGATVGSGPLGTVTTCRPSSSHQFVSFSAVKAVTAESSPQRVKNQAWDAAIRSWNYRRRRGVVQDVHLARIIPSEHGRLPSGAADPAVDTITRSSHKLPWMKVRGGAGTRVDIGDRILGGDDSADEQSESGSEGAGEVVGDPDIDEDGIDGVKEDKWSRVLHFPDTSAAVVDGKAQDQAGGSKNEDRQDSMEQAEVAKAVRIGEEGSTGTTDETAKVEGEGNTAAAGEGAEAAGSAALKVGLGEVVPALMKSGAAFLVGTWLAKKLSPSVAGQVRAARIVYTGYLIFSQALCMYLRYLIWQRDDDTDVAVPPPPQLKKMVEGVGGAGTAAAAGEKAGAALSGVAEGAASPLAPMLEKLLTSRTPAKEYDMKVVQGMRRGQFWASLFMCFTHLKRGMIKPMILQVSFGVLALLDSPLFKIYVLGRQAEGDLARPFRKQGFMASLSGPMEGLAAKAEEARVAAEAASEKGGAGARQGSDASGGVSDDDSDAGAAVGANKKRDGGDDGDDYDSDDYDADDADSGD